MIIPAPQKKNGSRVWFESVKVWHTPLPHTGGGYFKYNTPNLTQPKGKVIATLRITVPIVARNKYLYGLQVVQSLVNVTLNIFKHAQETEK